MRLRTLTNPCDEAAVQKVVADPRTSDRPAPGEGTARRVVRRDVRPRLDGLLYVGSMVLSTAILTLVEVRLARHPELTDGADDADPVNGAANVALLLVALVITLVVPVSAARAWRRLRT